MENNSTNLNNCNSNFDMFIDVVLQYFNINHRDESFFDIIKTLDINENDKKILFRRITELLQKNSIKIKKYKLYMQTLKFIMMVFSIILTFTSSFASFVNWNILNYINLGILFSITLSTNVFFQNKIGDKYIIYKKANLKINSEIWSFIMSTNLYSNKTHEENLQFFYSNIEHIYNSESMEILEIIKKSNNPQHNKYKYKFQNLKKKYENNNNIDISSQSLSQSEQDTNFSSSNNIIDNYKNENENENENENQI